MNNKNNLYCSKWKCDAKLPTVCTFTLVGEPFAFKYCCQWYAQLQTTYMKSHTPRPT